MSKSRITIKDLARELNISTSTVSRALADKWDVNPETRKAVLELAEKMNYHPNPISLSLKQNQTMSIGVIVHKLIFCRSHHGNTKCYEFERLPYINKSIE